MDNEFFKSEESHSSFLGLDWKCASPTTKGYWEVIMG